MLQFASGKLELINLIKLSQNIAIKPTSLFYIIFTF